jgi:hypothetical protein
MKPIQMRPLQARLLHAELTVQNGKAMQMWKQGIIDDRPIKERWSREFKNPRVKRLKDRIKTSIDEKNKKRAGT